MTDPVFIVDQLQRMHGGGAWHGPSMREALAGVSFDLATQRLGHAGHSIFDLLHHIAAWTGEVHERLKGRAPQLPDDGDFPDRRVPPTEADWIALRQHAEARQAELIADLELLDAARLQDAVSTAGTASERRTLATVLHGLVQHNAYHIGQIILIRRALGG
ncbi:MAG: hypothetical protein MNPFHGCM_02036 [Gemmatimonadaceae bacterium]|nr:hypothetical protein [Gemmatimonadaceae bacterium]